MEKVHVLGAGFAGLNAALELASHGFEVELVDRGSQHIYIPGLINLCRDRVGESSLRLDLEDFLEGTGIEFVRSEVERIEPENGIVELEEGRLEYENLVVALGSEARSFGIDLSDAFVPYGIEGARNLSEELDGAEQVSVIGSGYVGVEYAGEIAERDVDVKLIDASTRPMPNSPEKASHEALEYFETVGIDFLGGRRATRIEEGTVVTEDGDKVESDIAVWSGGIQAPELIQESFECGPEGIDVNSGLCSTEYRNVFALGDSANSGALKTAHNAMEQAETVAENISRQEGELQSYDDGTDPLVVSLGDQAMFLYGDFVLKNRFLRYLKDLVRYRYWFVLKRKKAVLRLRNILR